ncbi:glycosyltransferase family 4 protein, partial [Chloroflexota bacterium]
MLNQIVFLTIEFPPQVGGIAHYLYEIVRHLPPARVRVITATVEGWEAFDAQQDYSIRRFDLPAVRSPLFAGQLKTLVPLWWSKKLLQERQADIILCGSAHPSLMVLAWLRQRIRGTPYGVFTHGLDLLFPQTRIYRSLFNALLRAAQVVFTNGKTTEDIVQGLEVQPDRIHVVHPSVDPAKLTSEIPLEAVRQRHGLKNKRCILTVGRLVERKGHDMVIRTMPGIIEAVPESHYLIVGTGPVEARLKTLVAELGLEACVTFAGYVPDEELAAYYRACDVFA